jgi:outer membrane lipoprotein SlyB
VAAVEQFPDRGIDRLADRRANNGGVVSDRGGFMRLRSLGIVLVTPAVLLAGCYTAPPYAVYDQPPTVAQRAEFGVVEAIDWYPNGQSAPTGLGAILGGVAGGVIGHQIGSGVGNTAATIAGAVGGALVGNQVGKSRPTDRYPVVVRLDTGGTLSYTEVGEGQLRVGDRVRIVNNRVYRA